MSTVIFILQHNKSLGLQSIILVSKDNISKYVFYESCSVSSMFTECWNEINIVCCGMFNMRLNLRILDCLWNTSYSFELAAKLKDESDDILFVCFFVTQILHADPNQQCWSTNRYCTCIKVWYILLPLCCRALLLSKTTKMHQCTGRNVPS